MPSPHSDSDSDDELPSAWEERATKDGYVYYVNNQAKSTQWTHPRTGKSKQVVEELPLGWEREIEESTGKVFFYNKENSEKTYKDPRLGFPKGDCKIQNRFDSNTTALQVLHDKDLSGKLAIITGANVGIGFETARSLAMHNCNVILACRNQQSAEAAIEKITIDSPMAGKRCRFMNLDLADLKSVQSFVEEIKSEFKYIDMLILNAAVSGLPYTKTKDNLEITFQVCHLSHFYMTTAFESLMDHMSRVVVVSSESHRLSMLPFQLSEEVLSPMPDKYWRLPAYDNAKLCNVLFTKELAKRWQNKGITVYSLHPGSLVATELSRNWWFIRLGFAVARPFTKSLQQATSTTVYCATATELTGISGQYYKDCYYCESSAKSQNEEMAKSLWDISEQIVQRILTN